MLNQTDANASGNSDRVDWKKWTGGGVGKATGRQDFIRAIAISPSTVILSERSESKDPGESCATNAATGNFDQPARKLL
jgi:hypothetical protein